MTAKRSEKSGRRAFLVDNAVVFGAHVLTRLRGLLVLPILVSTLGAAAYGTWSQSLTFAALTSAIVGLSLHLSLVRFSAAEGADRGRIFTTILLASFGMLVVSAVGLLVLCPPEVVRTFIGTQDQQLFAATLAMMVMIGLRNLILNLFRATGHLILRSAIDLTSSAVDLVVIVVALWGGRQLLETLVASLLVNTMTVAVSTVLGFRIAPPSRPSKQVIVSAVRYGLPLVPATLAIWVLDRGDRFVISHFLDQEAVGIYSAQYTIGSLMTLVLGPIQTTLVPKVAQLWDADRASAGRYVVGCFRFYFALSAMFLGIAPALAPKLLAHFGSTALAEGASLNVAAIGLGVALWGLGVIVQMPLFGSKNTGAIGTATAAGAVLNLMLNLVSVPFYGIRAAALATSLTYLVTLALFARATARVMPLDFAWGRNLRAVAAAAVVGVPVALVAPDGLLGIAITAAVGAAAFLVTAVALGVITEEERALAKSALSRFLPGKPKGAA